MVKKNKIRRLKCCFVWKGSKYLRILYFYNSLIECFEELYVIIVFIFNCNFVWIYLKNLVGNDIYIG